MKDTAGFSVLIEQVSLHKQLINKSCPPPFPPNVFACLFHFMTAQYYTLLSWMAASVYYAHGGCSDLHNDTIVTLPHMPGSHLPNDPGVSWHILVTKSIHGTSTLVSFLTTDVYCQSAGCEVIRQMFLSPSQAISTLCICFQGLVINMLQ